MNLKNEDISGKKFGFLTAIKFSHRGIRREAWWLCNCDCGNERLAVLSELKRLGTISCGCKNRPSNGPMDLSGQKFGKFTALKIAHKKNTKTYWECICDCGAIKIVPAESLRKGTGKIGCGKCFYIVDDKFIERKKKELLARSKIDKNNCWNFTGAKRPNGYHGIGWRFIERSSMTAHRASYICFKGPIPKGLFVLHTCDNKSCVNPDHLYIGDAKQNSKDAVERKRLRYGPDPSKGSKGEKNGKAKLDAEKVKFIRFMCDNGFQKNTLSDFFNVNETTINSIAKRKTWNHI